MGIFATFGVGIVFVFVFMVIIGGFFMWIAAKIARVEKSSFGRAMAAAVATSTVSALVTFLFGLIPLPGDLAGLIAGLALAILVIKAVFGTGFGKAFVVCIFYLAAAGIAVVLASMVMASSLLLSRGI